MMPHFWSIRAKLIAAIVLTIGLMGLSMIFFIETLFSQKLQIRFEKRAATIARVIARDSIEPLLTERYVDLELMIRDFARAEKDIAYIYLADLRGEIVAHTFEGGFPPGLLSLSDDQPGNGDGAYRKHIMKSEQGEIHEFIVPLLDGKLGQLHVGMSRTAMRKDLNGAIALLTVVIVVLLLIGIGVAALQAAAITYPVRRLAGAVAAMERGDLRARAPVHSDDEVGQLASAFNKMAETRMRVEEMRAAGEKQLRDITSNLGEGVLVLDTGGRLLFMNPEAEQLLGWTEGELKGKDVHSLVHSRRTDGNELLREECPSIRVLSTGVRETVDEDVFTRRDGTTFPTAYISAPIVEHDETVAVVIAFRDITEPKRRETEREKLILDHLEALSKVKTLSGLLPICASCKKIRDDSGYWNQIESYIRDHSDAEFSHGICPECAQKIYPDYLKKNGR